MKVVTKQRRVTSIYSRNASAPFLPLHANAFYLCIGVWVHADISWMHLVVCAVLKYFSITLLVLYIHLWTWNSTKQFRWISSSFVRVHLDKTIWYRLRRLLYRRTFSKKFCIITNCKGALFMNCLKASSF